MVVADKAGSQCGPSPESIRAELDRTLASVAFRNSDRLSRFLRFVVERTLAKEGEGLKEYRIGVEVFGRPSSYDPRLDPVVRLEARRLRFKLQQYYETEGHDDPIRIEVPKGGYSALSLQRTANAVLALLGVPNVPRESNNDGACENLRYFPYLSASQRASPSRSCL